MLLHLLLLPLFQGSTPSAPLFEELGPAGLGGATLTSGSPQKDWILEVNGGGLLLGDFDADGLTDLVLVDGSTPERVLAGTPGLPPRLFLGQGDATFAPAGDAWQMEGGRWGTGGAVGDLDGDGREDLVVTEWGPDRVLRNTGAGFEPVAEAGLVGERWGTSAALFDLDLDGVLDLAVVNYLDFGFDSVDTREGGGCIWKGHAVNCGPEGLEAQHDQLYRGRGDGTFELAEAGFAPGRAAFGLGVVAGDFDVDGDLDLYVTNDSTPNHLWDNRASEAGHELVEVGMRRGVALDDSGREQAGMGVGAGDLDGDGRADFVVTNFSGESHNLYLSGERRSYRDRSHQLGIGGASTPLLGWGTGFGDLDLDGDLDLFAVHGHVYPQADEPGTDTHYAQPDLLWRNVGSSIEPSFEVEDLSDAGPTVSRAAASADLDRDGDLDLIVIELDGAVRVLRNRADELHEGAHWLGVRLVDPTEGGSRSPIGARLELVLPAKAEGEPKRLARAQISTTGGYQAAVPAEAHFGLGDAGAAELLRVIWPDGQVQELEDPALDRWITVERSR
ncbi:MAG: CRTAC1 family protein [Planctomycetota bacterium]|nr:CRTAC1 family protein [Planctomycetota bacterium]